MRSAFLAYTLLMVSALHAQTSSLVSADPLADSVTLPLIDHGDDGTAPNSQA
jgi:hypothetical protein